MLPDEFLDVRILIIDDEPANVRLLERILEREGFREVTSTNDPREGLALYSSQRPDLVLLDLHMPQLDGFAVLERLRTRTAPSDFVPILVLTADITPDARMRALQAGARDFLTKPVDPAEVVLRIRNLVQTQRYYGELQDQNATLERKVSERTRDLERAQIEILERLARAAEYRDDETGHHAQRVGHLSAVIGRQLGLDDREVILLRRAAPLHDVGKIGVPDSVLLKPGPLTDEEFDEMKKHTALGAGILSGSHFPVLQLAEEIALYHHENWDGTGYMNMEGDLVPLSARIVRAADVFDALTHERPYKEAWSVDDALRRIRDMTGWVFHREVTDALIAVHEDGRLEVNGAPPPIAEIFRTSGHDRTPELEERVAVAEGRVQTDETAGATAR